MKTVNKTIIVGILGLAVLGAIIIPVCACFSLYPWVEAASEVEQEELPLAEDGSWIGEAEVSERGLRPNWRLRLIKRWLMRKWRRPFRVSLELSEEFKDEVMEIAEEDEEVGGLLDEGYNVTAIKILSVKATVQGDGQILTEVEKVLLMLVKDKYNRAVAVIDFEAEEVIKVIIFNVTVISEAEAP